MYVREGTGEGIEGRREEGWRGGEREGGREGGRDGGGTGIEGLAGGGGGGGGVYPACGKCVGVALRQI